MPYSKKFECLVKMPWGKLHNKRRFINNYYHAFKRKEHCAWLARNR